MQNHIRKVHAYLAVTCHPRFGQNDRGLLRATAVTRGWNGYRNESQHRKLTWRRKFSRRSCRDSNPRPFDHESGALTTELSPLPMVPWVLCTKAAVAAPVFAAGHLVTWVLCTKAAPQSLLQVIWLHGFCARRLPHSLCCRSFGYMGFVHEGCPTVFAAGRPGCRTPCFLATGVSTGHSWRPRLSCGGHASSTSSLVMPLPVWAFVVFSFFAPAVPVGRGWPRPTWESGLKASADLAVGSAHKARLGVVILRVLPGLFARLSPLCVNSNGGAGPAQGASGGTPPSYCAALRRRPARLWCTPDVKAPPPPLPRPFSLQALLVVHTPLAHCRPPPPPSLPVPLAHRYLFGAVSGDGRGGRVGLQHMERTLVSLSRRSASVSQGLVLCPDPLLPATQPLRPRFELAVYESRP